jgi:hypothetical protein
VTRSRSGAKLGARAPGRKASRRAARMLSSGGGDPPRRARPGVAESAWAGYVRNVGVYAGNRAICNRRGTVLADFRTRVDAQRFRSGPAEEDEFLLWRTTVATADGADAAEDEWSRDELAELGALAADGSFSTGPAAFERERFTVEQCLCDGDLRVRTIHAYDWEGGLCGVVASRERREPSGGASAGGVEPAAWRSPSVLLDYMLGEWRGCGVLVDRAGGGMRTVTSVLTLRQSDSLMVTQESGLAVDGGPRGALVRARAQQDGNVLFFAESGVQLVLLPGGVSAASPVRVEEGRRFVVETGFLVRPDCRKRVVRCYNADAEWVNTVFLTERRVG